MKIAFACDHAGFATKSKLIDYVQSLGHEVKDFGCYNAASCDYPDYGIAAATAVASGEVECGVLVCGSGIGMSIVANKVSGVRAALVCNDEAALLAREHNNSNMVCFAARFAPVAEIIQWLGTWLAAQFSNEPRHQRRLDKIRKLEGNK
jgi:ribose 5-phosphate isomerase B